MDNYSSTVKITKNPQKESRNIVMGSTKDMNKTSSNSSANTTNNNGTNLADITAKILQKQYKNKD